MIIEKSEVVRKSNSSACTVSEYPYPSRNSSIATAQIDGRYPEKGRALNTKCEMAYYVISGEGVVHTDRGDFLISEGDLYYFETGERYWIEGDSLFVVVVNAPAWTPEQYSESD